MVGMGKAAELAARDMKERIEHLSKLREKTVSLLEEKVDEIYINGDPDSCLPNLVSASVRHIEGEAMVLMLEDDKFAVSTRSACASGALRASHVLLSIEIGRAHV